MRKNILYIFLFIFGIAYAQTSEHKNDNILFPVIKEGELGYIDKRGNIKVQFEEYIVFDDFSDGVVGRHYKSNFVIIDTSGATILTIPDTTYGNIHPFREGMAIVQKNGKFGFIDKNGTLVVPMMYNWVRDFSEGLAAVSVTGYHSPFGDGYIGGKWDYIDKTGKNIIEQKYSEAHSFSEGLAAIKDGDKVGYIDKSGKLVIKGKYFRCHQFSEGLARVEIKRKDKHSYPTLVGYINKKGKFIIKPQYFGGDFSDSLAAIWLEEGCGFIDHFNNVKFIIKSRNVGDFHEGRACVKINDKYGFINKEGKLVIEPIYKNLADFHGGLARVWLEEKMGYIDTTGKYIWIPTK